MIYLYKKKTMSLTKMSDVYTIADISIWPWIYALYMDYDDAAAVIIIAYQFIACAYSFGRNDNYS